MPFLDPTPAGFSIRSQQVLAAREEHWYAKTPFGYAILGESADMVAAITVPLEAISLRDGFSYRFTVGADNRVKRLKVQLGRRSGEQVEVIGCPLVREADGLARSSRNAYLDADARHAALALSGALRAAVDAVRAGARDRSRVEADLVAALVAAPGVDLDYAEVLRGADLVPTATFEPEVEYVAAVAARVGAARLIDNVTLTVGTDGAVRADLGVLRGGDPFPGS